MPAFCAWQKQHIDPALALPPHPSLSSTFLALELQSSVCMFARQRSTDFSRYLFFPWLFALYLDIEG